MSKKPRAGKARAKGLPSVHVDVDPVELKEAGFLVSAGVVTACGILFLAILALGIAMRVR